MQWVAVDGPYNEHLLRDLGGANLSLAVIILYAIARPRVEVVRAVAAAILVAQVPHFIYHAAHLEVLPTALDRVLQTASLALTWQFRSSSCAAAVSARSMRRRPLNRPE